MMRTRNPFTLALELSPGCGEARAKPERLATDALPEGSGERAPLWPEEGAY